MLKMKKSLKNPLYSFQENEKKSCFNLKTNKHLIIQLFLAIKNRANLDSIKGILHNIDDVNVGYCYNSRTPLHHAVHLNSDLDIIEELISKGADINARDTIGRTPLQLAVISERDLEYVPRLLALGADVNSRDCTGETALYLVMPQFKNLSVVNMVIKMLLEHGAEPDLVYGNDRSSSGISTILDKAVLFGAVSSAKLLIKTIFLKNFVKDFSKVLELKKNPRINRDDLSKFMVRCIHELVLMRKTKISSSYSMFDFAQFGINLNVKPLYTNAELTDSELTKMFPIYCDIIQQNITLALQRGQCINQFRDLQGYRIYNRHDLEDESKEVILNFDCIEKVCSYLTNQDLMNFTQAFHVSLQMQE